MSKAPHGGDFFKALGEDFSHLDRLEEVVSADVLDAWYPPAPSILEGLRTHLEWFVRTSPPTHAEGLRAAIAQARGIEPDSILLGAGSSSLMFLAFPKMVAPGSKVVLLDPMYGEYRHLFEQVIPCQVDLHPLVKESDFALDVRDVAATAMGADLLVLVNPNSPTGQGTSVTEIDWLLGELGPRTKVWIDETYIDFAPDLGSAESLVAKHPQLVVSKSMSKFYALSGLRLGYLTADPSFVAPLDQVSPPWGVGMMAQYAGIHALQEEDYYRQRAYETDSLRKALASGLGSLGFQVVPSRTNYLLCRMPAGNESGPLVARCAEERVFLRDCASISPRLGHRYVRIAVKPEVECARILSSVAKALRP